jgi:hypothetical protein
MKPEHGGFRPGFVPGQGQGHEGRPVGGTDAADLTI